MMAVYFMHYNFVLLSVLRAMRPPACGERVPAGPRNAHLSGVPNISGQRWEDVAFQTAGLSAFTGAA
jgi:hypothetical protein